MCAAFLAGYTMANSWRHADSLDQRSDGYIPESQFNLSSLVWAVYRVLQCKHSHTSALHVPECGSIRENIYINGLTWPDVTSSVQMVEKYLWTMHGCKPAEPTEEECRLERRRLVWVSLCGRPHCRHISTCKHFLAHQSNRQVKHCVIILAKGCLLFIL